jgi:SAM-dependent methyltransferase
MAPDPLPHGLEGRDEQQAYFDWIAGLFGDALAGDVLDHGAGTGILSERLLARAARVVALEPEPVLFDRLCQRFASSSRVTPLQGTLATYLARHGPGRLDAVVSSNVLEHLPDDLDCLCQMREALRPGGALAIYVPARPELFGSLDQAVGHVRRYTRPTLNSRLEQAGFFVEWVRYANLAGVLPWLVSGRVLRRRAIASQSLRWFDRWIFPASARLEALLPIPYGLNLAALARRP